MAQAGRRRSAPHPAPAKPAAGFADPSIVGAFPSVSDDGRWVVYQGEPTDGSGRSSTIWLREQFAVRGRARRAGTPDATRSVGRERPPRSSAVTVAWWRSSPRCPTTCSVTTTPARGRTCTACCPSATVVTGDLELVSTRSSADGDTSALDRVDPTDAPAISQAGTVISFTHQAREGQGSAARGHGRRPGCAARQPLAQLARGRHPARTTQHHVPVRRATPVRPQRRRPLRRVHERRRVVRPDAAW